MPSAPTLYPLYIASGQGALFCRACGRGGQLKASLCLACYSRERRNRSSFAGLRPRVLARDHHCCRVCARQAESLHVHHRRPGVSREPLLITLCPACHVRIHHTRCWRSKSSSPAAGLWREQHPDAPEQLALDFDFHFVPGVDGGHCDCHFRPLGEAPAVFV